MKLAVLLIGLVLLMAVTWFLPAAGTGAPAQGPTADGQCLRADQAREYPIAAGIWYPTDGPLPDRPVRYYRVRCWPGCHSGSTLGMHPEEHLDDRPIFPTSTIDLKD